MTSSLGPQPPGRDEREHLRVGVRGHPVAAEQLQLVGDDPVHRHAGAVAAGSRPTWTCRPRRRRQSDRGRAGGPAAERVEREVRAAAGELATAAATSSGRPASTADGAASGGPASSAAGAMSTATTRRAAADRDHHRGEADAATAVHGDPLAGRAPGPARTTARNGVANRQPRLAAASSSSSVGQPYEVDVGVLDERRTRRTIPSG